MVVLAVESLMVVQGFGGLTGKTKPWPADAYPVQRGVCQQRYTHSVCFIAV